LVHAQDLPALGSPVQSAVGFNSAQEPNDHVGQSVSAAPTSLRPDAFEPALGDRLNESTWYTRQEYFHWNERFDHADFVNEYGLLTTLGYQKRLGIERFRGELFAGTMRYVGGVQFDDGTSEPLTSQTGYLGLGGEYDLMIEPEGCPN